MPKKVLIALMPGMLSEIDVIAAQEHRTRSDLIREALRQYMYNFQQKQLGLRSATMTSVVPFPPRLTAAELTNGHEE